MKFAGLALFAVMIPEHSCPSQQLTEPNRKIVDAARSRYYSLKAAGFLSMSCAVRFDWQTVPNLPLADALGARTLLQHAELRLSIDESGRPQVQEHYPEGISDQEIAAARPLADLLKAFVVGVFQTWPTKGLQGPIPPFNAEVESVTSTGNGFDFSLHVPGAPVHVITDSDYRVKSISSLGGKVEESPRYEPSPDGLIFAGNHGIDHSLPDTPADVSYDLGSSVIDGLHVPSSVHLKVNQNIDVRYTLESCSVHKAQVLKVEPPK